MAFKYTFTPEERARVVDAIQNSFRIEDEAFLNKYIDGLQESGKVLSFGYGSLIKVPANNQETVKYRATVQDMSARFNCGWRFYGSTHETPSLMQGLEKNEGGITPGEVTELSFIKADCTADIDGLVKHFVDFKIRENPPGQDVYAYNQDAFLEVHPDDGGAPVIALGCVSDTSGPLFIGSDGENLTVQEKAMSIANEWGVQKNQRYVQNPEHLDDPAYGPGTIINDGDYETRNDDGVSFRKPHQRTIYSYLIETIDSRLQTGMPVEQELWDLTHYANYYREQMDPDKREFWNLWKVV